VSWYDWPESRPIRVEGGLVARSERGAIGTTWWSQRFLSVLESFGLGTRLTRGKAYARQGQVLALTVSPGVVAATVQGSRAKPYKVSIGFPALDDHSWAQIESSLGAQAVHRAQLLAGDMPKTLEEVVESAGWSEPWKTYRRSMSRPLWTDSGSRPCHSRHARRRWMLPPTWCCERCPIRRKH
jgi:hypothetical protein